MILFEIDFSTAQEEWFNYSTGIWVYNTEAVYSNIADEFLIDAKTSNIQSIGSVYADKVKYSEVDSIGELVITQSAYYIDGQTIYLHTENNNSPSMFEDISLGVIFGYANDEETISNVLYRGYLKDIGSITKNLDDLFYGKISFNDTNATMINTDGYWDSFVEENNMFGAPCRVRYNTEASSDINDYYVVWTGYISGFSVSPKEATIEIQDDRRKLTKNLILNYYNTTDYADLKPANQGKAIPICYGKIRNAEAICTNELATTTSYDFKVCDTNYSYIASQTVDILKDDLFLKSVTLNENGEFTLSDTEYSPGDEISVSDFEGYVDEDNNLIENSVNIIKDILFLYLGVTNIPSFYKDFKPENGNDQFLYINKDTKIYEAIEKLSYSDRAMFYIEIDGRYSYIKEEEEIIKNLSRYEILSKSAINYDVKDIISTANILYSKDVKNDTFINNIVNTYESEVFEKYNISVTKNFKTNLVNKTDTDTFAEEVLNLYRRPVKKTSIEIPNCILLEFINDFRLRKTLFFEYERYFSSMFGQITGEIIGFSLDLVNHKTSIDLRITSLFFKELENLIFEDGTNFIYIDGDNFVGGELYD